MMTESKSIFTLGRKIKRKEIEENAALVKLIKARSAENGDREVSIVTLIKKYLKYVNSSNIYCEFEYLTSVDDIVLIDQLNAQAHVNNAEKVINYDEVEVETIKMKDKSFDPGLFVPIKSGLFIDRLISNKEGLMPATTTIVIGDPGIGKTSVMLDVLSNMKKLNPDKKFLFVSGEMDEIDLAEYMERIPGADDIDIFFPMNHEENCPIAFKKLLDQGWDVVLFDSFDEIKDTMNSYLKLSSTKAEKWMIDDIMNTQKGGKNQLGKFTAFLAIQQMTKGGKFVGSNKLKHNTTAMLEIRFDSSNKTKMYYTKNRRGNVGNELYFSITDNGIDYDELKYNRDVDWKNRIEEDEKQTLNEDSFKELFSLHEEESPEEILIENS